MKTLELFSGMGGLASGLELAGFSHAQLVEFNKHACSSLRKNFSPSKVFEGDIRNFKTSALSDIDFVAGGPPCQPFSLGGKHKGFDDERDMFPYAIRTIQELKPKFFLFENVKGLLRASFNDYFSYIIQRLKFPEKMMVEGGSWREHLASLQKIRFEAFDGLKYRVHFQLVNAADYGVPQTRERVIIIGVRDDVGIQWSFPAKTHCKERLLWDQHVTGEYWQRNNVQSDKSRMVDFELAKRLRSQFGLFEPELKPWVTVREALRGVPDPKSKHEIPDHVFRAGAKVYSGHTGSLFDMPSKTIKAGAHGVPGGENMIAYPDGSVRYLTVFEAKKLQTFPDDFVVEGAWGEAMRQIGNAVPVKLAEVMGNHLQGLYQQSLRQRMEA